MDSIAIHLIQGHLKARCTILYSCLHPSKKWRWHRREQASQIELASQEWLARHSYP